MPPASPGADARMVLVSMGCARQASKRLKLIILKGKAEIERKRGEREEEEDARGSCKRVFRRQEGVIFETEGEKLSL